MKRNTFEDVKLDVSLGRAPAAGLSPDEPFRILIAGDFSVLGSREKGSGSHPVPVDRDNFDEVFHSMNVELEMPLAGRIRFAGLDDFHPDRCFEALPLFARLREARERPAAPPAPRPATTPVPGPEFEFGSLLDDAVDATESRAEARAARDPLRQWLDDQVEPYREQSAGAQAAERQALVDSVISAQMRAVLHYPAFQAIESLWTMIHFLVRRIDTDSQLRLYLFDISGKNADQLAQQIEQRDWAVVAVASRFGPSSDDLKTLETLGRAAAGRGAVLLADAKPQLIGCDTFSPLPEHAGWAPPNEEWQLFRRSDFARSVGLVLPRILLRMPYGKRTDPCSQFAFEELGEEFDASRLLWGSGALASLALIGESFSEAGWQMRPGLHQDLEQLPLYVHGAGESAFVVPCAETLMRVEAAEAILERGPMVLASMKDTDRVKMIRFQSVAEPLSPLAGRWRS